MPLVSDRQTGPIQQLPDTPEVEALNPTTGEIFGAAFRIENSLVSAAVNGLGESETEEGFDETGSLHYKSDGTHSFSGFNLVAGVLVDLSALKNPLPLKLGASLSTPFQLAWDYSYEDSDGNSGTDDWIVEMPLMVGFGASYRMGDFLTLAADAEFRAHGGSEVIVEVGDNSPLSENKEDIF